MIAKSKDNQVKAGSAGAIDTVTAAMRAHQSDVGAAWAPDP